MPILSWVNDNQARQEASKVPFHLLEKVGVYGDANSENLLVQGDWKILKRGTGARRHWDTRFLRIGTVTAI